MGKVRVTFAVQKEVCRENGTAYYEKVILTPGTYVGSTTTFKLLMCGKPDLKGGQCMPKKCRDIRVIEALQLLDKEGE